MQGTINQLAVLFILLALGYIVGKARLLTADGGKMLSRIVLYITTPCTILSSVLNGDIKATGAETAYFILASILAFALYFLLGVPASRSLDPNKKDRGLYAFMVSFGNCTFMGFPVITAIFGASSAFYVALYNIPFMILSFSAGVVLVSGRGGKFNPRALLTPSLIAALLAVPIAVTGFKAPYIISEAVRLTGNVTTPASMLVVGSSLSRIPFKFVFTKLRLYVVTLMKLVIMPVAVWLVFKRFIPNDIAFGTLVVLSGMPTASMAAMFALEYDADEQIASGGIFMTTLLSGATIPIIAYFLLR